MNKYAGYFEVGEVLQPLQKFTSIENAGNSSDSVDANYDPRVHLFSRFSSFRSENVMRDHKQRRIITRESIYDESRVQKTEELAEVIRSEVQAAVKTVNRTIFQQKKKKNLTLAQRTLNKAVAKPINIDKAAHMMEMMGWQGGPLGKSANGIAEPITPNAMYATKTGFGQTTEKQQKKDVKSKKVKNQKPRRQGTKNNFVVNVLLSILDFVKDDYEIEVMYDSKLPNHERKRIHQIVEQVVHGPKVSNIKFEENSEIDLVIKEIKRLNAYLLMTCSEGELPERSLCLYKEAPSHLYVVTHHDLRDETYDETDAPTVTHVIDSDNYDDWTMNSDDVSKTSTKKKNFKKKMKKSKQNVCKINDLNNTDVELNVSTEGIECQQNSHEFGNKISVDANQKLIINSICKKQDTNSDKTINNIIKGDEQQSSSLKRSGEDIDSQDIGTSEPKISKSDEIATTDSVIVTQDISKENSDIVTSINTDMIIKNVEHGKANETVNKNNDHEMKPDPGNNNSKVDNSEELPSYTYNNNIIVEDTNAINRHDLNTKDTNESTEDDDDWELYDETSRDTIVSIPENEAKIKPIKDDSKAEEENIMLKILETEIIDLTSEDEDANKQEVDQINTKSVIIENKDIKIRSEESESNDNIDKVNDNKTNFELISYNIKEILNNTNSNQHNNTLVDDTIKINNDNSLTEQEKIESNSLEKSEEIIEENELEPYNETSKDTVKSIKDQANIDKEESIKATEESLQNINILETITDIVDLTTKKTKRVRNVHKKNRQYNENGRRKKLKDSKPNIYSKPSEKLQRVRNNMTDKDYFLNGTKERSPNGVLDANEIMSLIIEYFTEFSENDDYTEFKFLGPFENVEIHMINDFIKNLWYCLNDGDYMEDRIVSVLNNAQWDFAIDEDPNGSAVIYKMPKI